MPCKLMHATEYWKSSYSFAIVIEVFVLHLFIWALESPGFLTLLLLSMISPVFMYVVRCFEGTEKLAAVQCCTKMIENVRPHKISRHLKHENSYSELCTAQDILLYLLKSKRFPSF